MAMNSESEKKAIEIFLSYTHEDEKLLERLEKHLSSLVKQGLIEAWHDRNISAGSEWKRAIDENLTLSDIIMLLISPYFIASEYCFSIEMRRAMEKHEMAEAKVIPVILRPTDWESLPFAALQCLPTGGKAVTLWQNIDSAFVDIAKGIRKVVEELTTKFTVSPHTPLWNVPYRRNLFFTGRENILEDLYKVFHAEKTFSTPIQAINGLGGVGKTQIAIEYAYRYCNEYRAVFWIKADSREDLISDFIQLAELLDIPLRNEANQSLIISAIKKWLQKHTNWLLIFDNIEDLSLVNDFVPLMGKGHVLITTRSQASGSIAHIREVEKMEQDEGVLFLLRRAKVVSSDASLESTSKANQILAQKILTTTDGLPLALDQAGAYIEETKTSLQDYLKLFQKRSSTLLKRRGRFISDHPMPVTATFLLSFEKVKRANSVSADLLQLCAFFHPDAIPEEIFTEGMANLDSPLQAVVSDTYELDATLEELLNFSLIRRNANTKTLSIHRLVQEVLKNEMSEEQQQQYAKYAVLCMNHLFPEVDITSWSLCQRYLPHTLLCAFFIEKWDIAIEEAANLFNRTGYYLYRRGQYADTKPLYESALAIRKRLLGPEHLDTIESLNRLGELYYMQGKFTEAEPLYKQVLNIREKVLGSEHLAITEILDNLEALYGDVGDYAQAIMYFERAITLRTKILGLEHLETADILINAASPYLEQGNYDRARLLLTQSLTIIEKLLGSEHYLNGFVLVNLGKVSLAQGRYSEAEQLLAKAIPILEQTLGPEHHQTGISLYYFSRAYLLQDKYEEAEPLLTRALAICEQALGPEHPSTAKCLDSQALLSVARNQYDQAEALYKRVLSIQKQALEPYHPDIAQTLENYADLLNRVNRENEAATLLSSAQEIRARYPVKAEVDEHKEKQE